MFEADEFLFTVVAALTNVVILEETLTHYRLHSNNLFQLSSNDQVKLQRKHKVLSSLSTTLPLRLQTLNVPEEVINAALEPLRVDSERLRLSLNNGSPGESFRTERAAFHLAHKHADFGYLVFKEAVLALSLLLPSRYFYRLRDWYSANRLSQFREVVGRAIPAAPLIKRN
jgi:hypothetical protein